MRGTGDTNSLREKWQSVMRTIPNIGELLYEGTNPSDDRLMGKLIDAKHRGEPVVLFAYSAGVDRAEWLAKRVLMARQTLKDESLFIDGLIVLDPISGATGRVMSDVNRFLLPASIGKVLDIYQTQGTGLPKIGNNSGSGSFGHHGGPFKCSPGTNQVVDNVNLTDLGIDLGSNPHNEIYESSITSNLVRTWIWANFHPIGPQLRPGR